MSTLRTPGLSLLVVASVVATERSSPPPVWEVHDMNRPQPAVVTPGATGNAPPSDALILFDGQSGDAWHSGGGDLRWQIQGGMLITAPGTGDITTRQEFGDVQMHIEWMIPADRATSGQSGGNSGVFFLGRYEVQILDSHGNETYPDGMAGALYGQHPPLVNPARPKGEWNTFDIIFRAPKFADDGTVQRPASATVFFNGVLIHDAQTFDGLTTHGRRAQYTPHPVTGPIRLQDHGDPIHFRNIWVRRLDGN